MSLPARMRTHLLWIDSRAGLTVGVFVLVLSPWLTELYRLPRWLVMTTGIANLAYGAYSGMLVRRERRPYALLVLLVSANAAWAVLCMLAALRFAHTASWLGLAHLVGEGLFVGGLAALEWHERDRLRVAP